ncbi:ErfK/YbiS/YcfS/YnhG family protein [Streptomyces viridosporus ATCC 14672]|uniref:ErfK/YbiS/YcfS/YnhG family protein n=1 Tax=Streptomyces viridosporus (strain ATCC 14672 / DSM 40746 / JCM 4963 / KCTC 9882 / NRRL B-12104 / FH 1290) TaxID=566461 RepID=D5ZW10_STRV1|nr:ErfK/YbiS/YcfS/YnhG family protein [Streptomyces viridosporus ATCC 14672]
MEGVTPSDLRGPGATHGTGAVAVRVRATAHRPGFRRSPCCAARGRPPDPRPGVSDRTDPVSVSRR